MPTEEDILEYVYAKGLCALIFSDDYSYELERLNQLLRLDSVEVLKALEDLADALQNIMDDQMKRNILNFVSYYRFDYTKEHPEDKKEVFDIANRIISIVSNGNTSKALSFTVNEMNIRRSKKTGVFTALRYFPDYWQLVKDENVGDFYMLYSHTEYTSDEEFLSLLAEIVDEKYGYASNMHSILTERPMLVKDEVFRQRLMMTISIIEKEITNSKESKDTIGELEKVKSIVRREGIL